MKKILLLVMSWLFLYLSSALGWGQREFPLKYRPAGPGYDPVLSQVRTRLEAERSKPSILKSLPEGLSGRVAYYVKQVAGKKMVLALDYGRLPKLYADTDLDGDLSDEKPFANRGRMSSAEFGPMTVKPTGAEGDLTVNLRAEGYIGYGSVTYFTVFPAGYFRGAVRLGEDSYQVAVVDGNLDGRLGGPASATDLLAIDFDRDGEFHYRAEVASLPKMVGTGGAYYRLEALPDGSAIRLQNTEPSLGTLDVASSHLVLTLFSGDCFLYLAGSQGRWQVPAGNFTTAFLQLCARDQAGARWQLTGSNQRGKLQTITVREGETLALKVGPPLAVKTDITQSRDIVSIGLSLAGQAGEEYTADAKKNGTTVPPPKLRILDEAGKVLASGAFQYG